MGVNSLPKTVFFLLHFTYLGGAYALKAPPAYGPGYVTANMTRHSQHGTTLNPTASRLRFLPGSLLRLSPA